MIDSPERVRPLNLQRYARFAGGCVLLLFFARNPQGAEKVPAAVGSSV
jgi:hypothetical protein